MRPRFGKRAISGKAGIVSGNVELHYDSPARLGLLHRVHLFAEVENLANRTYVGSALNVTDSLTATGAEAGASVLDGKSGSIFAGAPRSVFGGVRIHFYAYQSRIFCAAPISTGPNAPNEVC